jgi:hypothetical protein
MGPLDEMEDCSNHIIVSSFLWHHEALHEYMKAWSFLRGMFALIIVNLSPGALFRRSAVYDSVLMPRHNGTIWRTLQSGYYLQYLRSEILYKD